MRPSSWQDTVLAVCGFVFAIALIPTCVDKRSKVHLGTSLLNTNLLLVNAIVYASLGLWYSFASCLLVSLQWAYIAFARG